MRARLGRYRRETPARRGDVQGRDFFGRRRSPGGGFGAPRRRTSARCRNGGSTIFIEAWTRRLSPPICERAAEEAKAFAAALSRQARSDRPRRPAAGERLGEAVKAYEAIQDLVGRIMSYAGLVYAGDTSDPARAKFYGDAQEKVTALAGDLLFFELELNRLDDALHRRGDGRSARAGHYRPWLEDIRKERPHQLSDEIEQLFLEKSVSGAAAWNRLFDDTIAALRFSFEGEELTLEPLLAKLQDADEKKREAAANALGKTLGAQLAHLRADHQHARQGQGNVRPLAAVRGHRRFAASGQSRRARSGRGDGRRGDRLLSAPVASLLQAESALVRQGAAQSLGSQRAAAESARAASSPGARRATRCSTPIAASRRAMSDIARRFFDEGWIDAPVRQGKSPGAFAHPTTPSAHPYVLVNYLGKPRDVMTLAHELGHGVHQVLAAPNGALMAPTPLTLAETASVFGEMLTFRALLASTADPAMRKSMLASKVEDMLNTVVRQIAFYNFERKLHTERKKGELTAQTIGDLWMSVQGESLGPAIDSGRDTRPTGPISAISSIRRSTSTPTPSAIAW